MAQFHVSTFCWADPGLALSHPSVQQTLIRPIRSHFTTMKCAFSSSDIPTASRKNSDYQPGGTFMATTGKWTTRGTGPPLKDPHGLGRWSGLCFLGKQGKRLAILTAYRSPRQQPTGGYGFLDQQHALLLSKGIKHPNVRKQFVQDIVKFINELQSDGYEVMVNLDANETVSDSPSKSNGIRQIMDECSLVDLHSMGPSIPPATYKYGHHRKIDFMLGTAALASHVCRFGFLAYDNGIFSKHRGLFVDLDFVALMGNVIDIPPVAGRRLQYENPLSVDRYLSAFKQYATDHNIWSRVQELITVSSSMTCDQCKECFDPIDRDVTRAMLHAEKSAKRPTGKYAWSPKLREAGLLTRYWHLRLKAIEQGLDLCIAIRALAARISELNIPLLDDLGLEKATIKTRWKTSLKELRKVRSDAFDHRAVHLLSILEMYQSRSTGFAPADDCSEHENQTKINRIQQLLNIEGMRKPFRAIHSAVPTSQHFSGGGGLSKLFVPNRAINPKVAAQYCDPNGLLTKHDLISMAQADKHSVEYATVIDGDIIQEEILHYNCEWFRQSSDTPFGSGVLYDLVGSDGLTEEADAIIDGQCIEYMGIPMSRELQVFLEECKRPESISPISSIISLENFKTTVKKWKESTSTSPSGRHLGHYKVSLVDDDIASLHTDMLNIPITHGFSPSRWTHSVTPLIEKDEGKPYLTRLRVIHLFEADYNLFLKLLFGKRLVKNSERSNALNDQQHGSRPRRMTTDALFLARLEKDILRQTKTNSAHMDNDATGCYDRIIPSLGMLACRRLGMPTNAIKCQADALAQMKYSVKTAHGISPARYSSTISEPLFGTGQGSGASPAIWLGLVVVLLNSLDRMSREDSIPALTFLDPWGEMLESWRVGAFVDDTNQGVLDTSHQLNPEELVEYLRQAGQMWERVLTISGGKLNLAKCSWTLQFWDWKNGRPYLRPSLPADPLLILTSGANPEQHIIRRHSNDAEIKGLGVYMNFLGTFSYHALQMRQKFDGIARRLGQSRLSPALTRVYYNAFYIPAATYSLPVTSMTDIELHQVQSKMTAATLNKLGYNRHYPHVVAYASQLFFGCGLLDLRLAQGLAHVQAILDYIGTDHKIGRVMLISLRNLQTEAGVSFDLLHHPQTELTYLTPSSTCVTISRSISYGDRPYSWDD